jgi:hypothetical protein
MPDMNNSQLNPEQLSAKFRTAAGNPPESPMRSV